jgi:hypothetical protein
MKTAMTKDVMTFNFGSPEISRRRGIREAARMDPRET